MDIADWRVKIDELDLKVVELINQRAAAAQEIGRLKNSTNLPIYEPEREKRILENVKKANRGPLPDSEIQHIFERIIDVMRRFQQVEIHTPRHSSSGQTDGQK